MPPNGGGARPDPGTANQPLKQHEEASIDINRHGQELVNIGEEGEQEDVPYTEPMEEGEASGFGLPLLHPANCFGQSRRVV